MAKYRGRVLLRTTSLESNGMDSKGEDGEDESILLP